jgi:signal transduction histidine kinase
MEASLRARLIVHLPASLPKAYGDRSTLGTVLTELITNAAKYSSAQVEVSAGADEQTVLFRVADRGIGIAPGHVERAFERYWQADSGDQREFTGVGLGLYLVRRIVERQHGWVYLRPRERGGTVAEVRLPRADVTENGEA